MDLASMRGPWQVASVERRRRRSGPYTVPCAERGHTRLIVTTEDAARDLAGLLNWCEIEEAEVQAPEP